MKILSLSGLFALGIFSYSFVPAPPEIKWMSWEQMEAAQAKQPKKVMVDVYTDWCGWCKKMDATTFVHPYIVNYVNKNYYAVKFNAETKSDITFKGKVWKNSGRYSELATNLLNNQMSFPTTAYLDEKLELLTLVPGYLDVPTAEKITYYFGSNEFKTQKWEVFEKQYKSKIK